MGCSEPPSAEHCSRQAAAAGCRPRQAGLLRSSLYEFLPGATVEAFADLVRAMAYPHQLDYLLSLAVRAGWPAVDGCATTPWGRIRAATFLAPVRS